MLLACNLHDPSITLDASWWNPIGMRATVSYQVHFGDTFIPDANVIGAPGRYIRDGWQSCSSAHYAASFLGAAEAPYWERGQIEEAQLAGNRARHLVEHIAEEAVQHAVRACGARSLNRPSALERTLRDLYLYIRHDNDDQVLAAVGRSALSRASETSFKRP